MHPSGIFFCDFFMIYIIEKTMLNLSVVIDS
jgi:hypothetical protein